MSVHKILFCLISYIMINMILTGKAMADLIVEFTEDAPKDFFLIANKSSCKLERFALEIDLNGSNGHLIFDSAVGGPGENVAQPLEIASGRDNISYLPSLVDGQRQALLQFNSLAPGERVLLTVDVDDTKPQGPFGQQMIHASEIEGAKVIMRQEKQSDQLSSFEENAKAQLKVCP